MRAPLAKSGGGVNGDPRNTDHLTLTFRPLFFIIIIIIIFILSAQTRRSSIDFFLSFFFNRCNTFPFFRTSLLQLPNEN